jgi:hypothetical protein
MLRKLDCGWQMTWELEECKLACDWSMPCELANDSNSCISETQSKLVIGQFHVNLPMIGPCLIRELKESMQAYD